MQIAGWAFLVALAIFSVRWMFKVIDSGRNKGVFHGGGVDNLENRSLHRW